MPIELRKGNSKEFYLLIKAKNGMLLFKSAATFSTREDALSSVGALYQELASHVEIKPNKMGIDALHIDVDDFTKRAEK